MSVSQIRQFISVTIGGEEYGVDVMAIREIKGWEAATGLPSSPPHMRGVINLRGSIVPILDLRARFGGGKTDASARHVIIVVAVGENLAGILADGVADILSITETEIQPVPELEQGGAERFLSGLVTVEGRMVAILDLGHVFDSHTLSASSVAA